MTLCSIEQEREVLCIKEELRQQGVTDRQGKTQRPCSLSFYVNHCKIMAGGPAAHHGHEFQGALRLCLSVPRAEAPGQETVATTREAEPRGSKTALGDVEEGPTGVLGFLQPYEKRPRSQHSWL